MLAWTPARRERMQKSCDPRSSSMSCLDAGCSPAADPAFARDCGRFSRARCARVATTADELAAFALKLSNGPEGVSQLADTSVRACVVAQAGSIHAGYLFDLVCCPAEWGTPRQAGSVTLHLAARSEAAVRRSSRLSA